MEFQDYQMILLIYHGLKQVSCDWRQGYFLCVKPVKERQARKVVDPPHVGSQGSKGFSMGRGRSLTSQASSNGIRPTTPSNQQGTDTRHACLPRL